MLPSQSRIALASNVRPHQPSLIPPIYQALGPHQEFPPLFSLHLPDRRFLAWDHQTSTKTSRTPITNAKNQARMSFAPVTSYSGLLINSCPSETSKSTTNS